MGEQKITEKEKKKSFFARMIDKLDKGLEQKAKKSSCCGGSSDKAKGSSCC